MRIEWLGHASFKIKWDGGVLYIDPYVIKNGEKADIIFITHEHFDHMDIGKIKTISNEETIIIAPSSAAQKIGGNVKVVREGESIKIKDIEVEVVPAYNISKPFHPRGLGVGYVIGIEGKRIYHAGDTDFIPEMEKIGNVDVALLPIGGTYTMDVEDAINACLAIKPKIAVPMHYNYLEGLERDPAAFKEGVEKASGIKVEILEERGLEI
ncbi:MAG TPA: MBL fold metallo-hydrolase, partial [Candidatus Aenigmarchaeota archaeon]|nr:MAG: MBL fold metallo-hydrolase [Candidatus Aenigmarchaeota archaeon]HDD46235.1 MBL fold metallo-hydrolase [Candidatus Aenigmarchaeota archaeon]